MMMTLKEISSGMPEAGEAGEMKRSALTAVLREEDGVSQPAGIRRRRRW